MYGHIIVIKTQGDEQDTWCISSKWKAVDGKGFSIPARNRLKALCGQVQV